jgi:hypothetical protein
MEKKLATLNTGEYLDRAEWKREDVPCEILELPLTL